MQQMELKGRVDALLAMARLTGETLSINQACAQAGVDKGNYLRWTKIVESGGPRAAKKKGRPMEWAITEDDTKCLKWFAAWTETFAGAVECFVEYGATGASPLPRNPHARPASALCDRLAAEIRRGGRWDTRLPKHLRAACRLTEHERRMIRGEKQYNDGQLSVRRLMVIRDFDSEGLIREIQMWAGAGFCSDDVSPEQPSQSESADGPRLNRQTLATHDIYSRKWLGLLVVNREGDAYTKVDQADHISAIVRTCGLPYYWSFERGPWKNDFIDGVKLETGWCEEVQRWGGLDGLFHVRHKFKPQHKTIEGAFSYLQSRMRGRALGVGSLRRGEHERATKIVSAAGRGNEDALRLIWNGTEKAEVLWQQMEAMGEREVRREFLDGAAAKPNDLWSETHQRRELPAADAWRLLPIKECRVIIKQRVSISLKGYGRFDFRCVDRGNLPLLDNGHRILIAFHPDRPEEGAAIFNGDLRAQFNRDGFKFGQFIGIAPHLPAVVMEDFTGTGNFLAHKQARGAVSSELRGFGGNHGGVVRVSRASDGLGKTLFANNAEGNDHLPKGKAPAPAPPLRRTRSIVDLMSDDTPAARTAAPPRRRTPEPELVSTGGDPWAEIS